MQSKFECFSTFSAIPPILLDHNFNILMLVTKIEEEEV